MVPKRSMMLLKLVPVVFQFRRITKCPLCKGHNGTLRNDGARCLLIDFTTSKTTKKSKKSINFSKIGVSDDEDEEEEMDVDGNKTDKGECIVWNVIYFSFFRSLSPKVYQTCDLTMYMVAG